MPLIHLSNHLSFPDHAYADDNGLLAIGGDLGRDRLLLAYRSGIFPWFSENEPIQWWSPDPRFVLFPDKIRISKSMKKVMQSNQFSFTINQSFDEVIRYCAQLRAWEGTWITHEMIEAYSDLHRSGYAVSAETWENGKLVGGLYGIRMGKLFFGESMFSLVSNASKYALIRYVQQLQQEGVAMIDCQVYTQHLESMGAEFISRPEFLRILKENISAE
jgi:leucyl/phenylalanyl-tRNA--protein transferase